MFTRCTPTPLAKKLSTIVSMTDLFFHSVSQAYSGKENPSSPNGSRTYERLINISVIYRWAKGDPWELTAIKLGLSAYPEKENLS